MAWVGLLLIGLAVGDAAFSFTRRPRLAQATGAASVPVVGLLAGLWHPLDLLALVVLALAVALWELTVTRAFAGGRAGVPLTVLAVSLTVAVLFSGAASTAGGPLGHLLGASDLAVLRDTAPDRALVVLGALLVQLATGNVVVRLVLAASGTTNPLRHPERPPPLKGGRLLGPMERVVILGLGLAGDLTAASIVIAAKGLLRFPELQSARSDHTGDGEPGIHEVTEYFLVGSFVSWLVALAALALAAA